MKSGRNNGITEGQKDGRTERHGESSIAPLFQSGAIIILDATLLYKLLKSSSLHVTKQKNFETAANYQKSDNNSSKKFNHNL